MSVQIKLNEWVSRAQLKIWAVLGAITVIGAIGTLAHSYMWAWLDYLGEHLGPPLFTAGVLGLTVDTFLKREIARDVFVAAFRYVLPDELKEEVRRIINYKFLCIESLSIIKINKLPNDLVRLDISHERIFKNITDHSEPFEGTFAVDEWGFTERSKIEACSISINDGDIKEGCQNPDYAGKKDAIGMKTQSVPVKSGATVKAVTKGCEIHRNNGELHMQFSHPSINPIVRVDVPDGLDHSCTFGIPGEKIIRSHISKQYRLDGTQFPGQHTRLRWWPT